MGRFNWYPWARYLGMSAGFFVLTGGVIGLFYPPNPLFGAVNIATGLLLMAWDWPLFPFNKLGFLSSNLIVRAAIHALAIGPCILIAPTLTAALCLPFAVLMFIRAAVNGEKWEAPKPRVVKKETKDMSAVKAPEN
ncbi:hypothetical protein DFS34DRAFT_616901 [Phlyctochytrium arcticum]|nr:hypothetical protein DFS34DRAFT_616901 [Phlyctochytrium arcticum]